MPANPLNPWQSWTFPDNPDRSRPRPCTAADTFGHLPANVNRPGKQITAYIYFVHTIFYRFLFGDFCLFQFNARPTAQSTLVGSLLCQQSILPGSDLYPCLLYTSPSPRDS